jgi:uncharacterized membrane protein
VDAKRILRHFLTPHEAARRALPDASMRAIGRAIAAEESKHAGEIRFVAEGALPWSYLRRGLSARDRAVMLFAKLRVWDTEHNTGVLVYLMLADRKVEIVADRGIARRVPQTTWNAICRAMEGAFRAGEFERGALGGIREIGTELARCFPAEERGSNELPDAPVRM